MSLVNIMDLRAFPTKKNNGIDIEILENGPPKQYLYGHLIVYWIQSVQLSIL